VLTQLSIVIEGKPVSPEMPELVAVTELEADVGNLPLPEYKSTLLDPP